MFRKHLVNLIIGLIGAFLIGLFFLFSPPQIQALDNALRDILFQARGEIPTTGDVVIVDLDEKSIAELGQWPWERDIVAQLLKQLSEDGAGIIGLDIVFAEADKTSPAYLNKKLNLGIQDAPDYDQILADTIANTPTILGYVFQMQEPSPEVPMPNIPAIIIEKNLLTESYLLKPKGVLANLPQLQNAAYSSGFFNNVPDPSGMVRNVPLVMKYQDTLYPSLTLEMLRIAVNSQQVQVNYDDNGIDHIQIGDLQIPTNRHGQLFINYRGGAKTFKYLSAIDVINGSYNTDDVNGKWILIGTSATGILDLRSMPFDNSYPGVEVHANVIDNILMGDMLSKPNWIEAADLILVLSLFFISYLVFNQLSAFWLSIVAFASFTGLYFFLDYMLFSAGLIMNLLFPTAALGFALVLSTLSNYFFETRQKNLVKNKLASKVSPSVMSEILKNETQDIMQGQTREITVFFSDLRNFTSLSEAMPNPQKLIQFLNLYTDKMTQIITSQQGTVDKFIGDAVMAYWNAPAEITNHADIAVQASLKQLEEAKKLNQSILHNADFSAIQALCQQHDIQPIEIGIGLNTGEAVVGEMGSRGRSDYTVIGDTVNLGSRLESLCKFYGSNLNISEYTKEQLQKRYSLRFLDKVTVKGKAQPVEIWQVHGLGDPQGQLQQELDQYHKAVELYQTARFTDALTAFETLNQQPNLSNTKICPIYIERCKYYIKHKPTHFNGVFTHTSKS